MTERIICAAVRHEDRVWMGHRHSYALAAMNDRLSYDMTRQEISSLHVEQGFMTSLSRFVSREDAMKIAEDADQVEGGHSPMDKLFSEDLY